MIKIGIGTLALLSLATAIAAQEPIFSGPQVGEKLSAFEVRGVLGDSAGKTMNFVKEAEGKPIVLIFVNELSRPALAFTRILTAYTVSRQNDGLRTGVTWLDDDATTAENNVKRVQHALTAQAPLGVSLDGREGPGSYGLNRNVALTILIGKDNQTVANFALVQPSLQADLPKVFEAIAKLIGGPVAKLEGLPERKDMQASMARSGAQPNSANDQLRPYLRPIIQRDATAEQVQSAIEKLEKFVADNPEAKRELMRIAKTIVENGKVTNYGTAPAQAFLEKWSKEK